jgi:hypothetical protein
MRKIIFASVFIIILLFIKTNLYSQVSIHGPNCVVPGITYTYNIQGNWDSLSTMKVCLTGGVIADSTDTATCTSTSAPLNAVTVIWNKVTNASFKVTSTLGGSTLPVVVTTSLYGGLLDTITKVQMIAEDSVPAAIICTEASGGACSPSYTYQWQTSRDMVSWNSMAGATNKNLRIDSSLTQSVYYRRKVVENTSGSVAYSDVASVFVGVTGRANTPGILVPCDIKISGIMINTYCISINNSSKYIRGQGL